MIARIVNESCNLLSGFNHRQANIRTASRAFEGIPQKCTCGKTLKLKINYEVIEVK